MIAVKDMELEAIEMNSRNPNQIMDCGSLEEIPDEDIDEGINCGVDDPIINPVHASSHFVSGQIQEDKDQPGQDKGQ